MPASAQVFPPPAVKKEKRERRHDRRESAAKEKPKETVSAADDSLELPMDESALPTTPLVKVKVKSSKYFSARQKSSFSA